MNVIVAGSREFDDYDLLRSKLDFFLSNKTDIRVVCGEAEGADQLGKQYAEANGYEVLSYPDQSSIYGAFAKYKRNREMARVADALVAFWDGKSKGTAQLIQVMKEAGKPIRIVYYKQESNDSEDEGTSYMDYSDDRNGFDAKKGIIK